MNVTVWRGVSGSGTLYSDDIVVCVKSDTVFWFFVFKLVGFSAARVDIDSLKVGMAS